ncbi:hypothetical protein V6N12_036608 [Hibiscus sabdariffa]|uniref:Uncharacterized protein n=1 Tax=Hibiscus sabdariffa TaxID=183260 RepID=A0ABR2ERK8_9ROSI
MEGQTLEVFLQAYSFSQESVGQASSSYQVTRHQQKNQKQRRQKPTDDKGDASAEATGPARADISAGLQNSAERRAVLLAYP